MSVVLSFGKLTAALCLVLAVVPASCAAASGSSSVSRSESMYSRQSPADFALDSLHEFEPPAEGVFPDGDLITVNGLLYGTTTSGGAYGAGKPPPVSSHATPDASASPIP